jgi:hypothetical protein
MPVGRYEKYAGTFVTASAKWHQQRVPMFVSESLNGPVGVRPTKAGTSIALSPKASFNSQLRELLYGIVGDVRLSTPVQRRNRRDRGGVQRGVD